MTTCQDMEELMSLRLDDLTTEEQRQMLSAHLTTCGRCAATWEAMQQASALLWNSPLLDAPAGFVDKVLLGLERREQIRRRWMRGVLLGGVILLSLLGVAGLVTVFWLGNTWEPLLALRASLNILFEQTRRLGWAVFESILMPWRLLGPSAAILIIGGTSFIAASSVALWAWAWERINRRAECYAPATSVA